MLHGTERGTKHKVGLLNIGQELDNVALDYRVMGVLRDRFYPCKFAIDNGGVEAVFDKNLRKPKPENRGDGRGEHHSHRSSSAGPNEEE